MKIRKSVTQYQNDIGLVLRNLERKGLIVSSLDPDGQIRWRTTEKGRHVGPDEVGISDELLN
jgi:hypothetical protein